MTKLESISPVDRIRTDPEVLKPHPGIALCLSGGGYRAMLFHLGTLWKLNDAGYLPRLRRISSVSGGSITAGMLGAAWGDLKFDGRGVAADFEEAIVRPIRRLAGTTVDIWAVLRGLFGPGTSCDHVAGAYRKHLYGDRTLQDLPDDIAGPRFVINASNLQSGALWRFSKPYAQDWRVGQIMKPDIQIAVAVAASSAFPPFLSPAVLRFRESDYTQTPGTDLHFAPYTTEVYLADGGVYDNLGVETAWKRHTTILVSDGGARIAHQARPAKDWVRHLIRVHDITDNQVRSLRKRQVIDSFKIPAGSEGHRDGAYWSVRTNIKDYRVSGKLICPFDKIMRLAAVPTRLARLDSAIQKRLINWGYAMCDAALRAYVDRLLPPPTGFPYPNEGVG